MSTERKPTVTETILVIGSVTAAQYEPVRLEIIRKGIKPKIVRIEGQKLRETVDYWENELDKCDDLTEVHELLELEWWKSLVKQCGPTYGIIFENNDQWAILEGLPWAISENRKRALKVFVLQGNGQLEVVWNSRSN